MKTSPYLPRGVYSAMMTPLSPAGAIDTEATCRLVQHQLQSGICGFYLTGSTGHGFLLTEAERQQLVETVVTEVRGRGKIIVHVGHLNPRTAAELARHAEAVGADAVSSVPPMYYESGVSGILLHYQTIAEKCRLPLLGYNVSETANGMSDEVAEKLMRFPNWGGFKFSTPNLHQMQGWIEKAKPEQVMFTGIDEMMLPGLVMGSDGSIGTFQNLFPREFVSILQDYDAGRIECASQTQFRLNHAIRQLLGVGELAAYKYAASLTSGIDLGDSPPPIPPLSLDGKRKVREILEREGFLKADADICLGRSP